MYSVDTLYINRFEKQDLSHTSHMFMFFDEMICQHRCLNGYRLKFKYLDFFFSCMCAAGDLWTLFWNKYDNLLLYNNRILMMSS